MRTEEGRNSERRDGRQQGSEWPAEAVIQGSTAACCLSPRPATPCTPRSPGCRTLCGSRAPQPSCRLAGGAHRRPARRAGSAPRSPTSRADCSPASWNCNTRRAPQPCSARPAGDRRARSAKEVAEFSFFSSIERLEAKRFQQNLKAVFMR